MKTKTTSIIIKSLTLTFFNLIFLFSSAQNFRVVSNKSTICSGDSAHLSLTGVTFGRYTQLDISPYANFNWNNAIGGWTPAPLTGSPAFYRGIPFNLPALGNNAWNANFATGGNPRIADFTLDCPVKVDSVYTLINTYWGEQAPGTMAQIDFVFADNSVYTKHLDGNSDIRDYINNSWANNINNTTTVNVYSGTASGRPSRLDMQQIAIPAPFNNKHLKQIKVIDNGANGVQRIVLNAITIALAQNDSVNWKIASPTGTLITYDNQIDVSPSVSTTYYAVNKYDNTCFDSVSINVTPASQQTFSQSICAGDAYWLNGVAYTTPGTYTDTLSNSYGCDSIVTINLSVNQPSQSTINQVICFGDSYTFGSNVYNSPGTYYDTLLNSVGCDSVITLNLSLLPAANTIEFDTICEGESRVFNGAYYQLSGYYSDTLTSVNGCDSLANLLLTVLAKPVATIIGQEEVCRQGTIILKVSDSSLASYSWNNGNHNSLIEIYQGGDYEVEIENEDGCKDTLTKYVETINCVDTCQVYLPNSFTPNNDGDNDSFYPIVTNGCRVYEFEMQIFNRWGERIYLMEDVDAKWNGDQASTGMYVWKMSYKFEENKPAIHKIGNVYLLK